MSHCANCGASLPHGAEFCPRCGANLTVAPPTTHVPPVAPPPAAPPPAAPAPAAASSARRWWIVPLVIIGVVIVAFAVMLMMPFGGEEGRPAREVAASDTVEEGAPAPSRPAETGTLIDLGQPPPATATTTTAMAAPPPVTTTVVTTPPPPPIEIERTPTPAPAPAPAAEISEGEAVATLRGYVTSRRYYDVGPECIGITSAGYRNAGYTLEVQDTCNSRSLGNWRVDSKTREVFRQREDGRFLRP